MSDPDTKTKSSGSLADRISAAPNPSSSSSTPAPKSKSTGSWADEVASPVNESQNTMDNDQLDGAVEPLGGSGLHDGEYDVEVKLSDIQGDVNSPLYSVQSFEELGM
jgi:ATP-dependent RNA helicase DDX19/DBP5